MSACITVNDAAECAAWTVLAREDGKLILVSAVTSMLWVSAGMSSLQSRYLLAQCSMRLGRLREAEQALRPDDLKV